MFRQYYGILPETLIRQLKSFRRRLWLVRIAETLFLSLINIAAAYLILYCSDRLWDTPGPVIWLLFAGSFTAALVFSPYWLVRWVALKRNPEQLARLIEQVMPVLGDKLRGVIGLAEEERRQDQSTSSALRRAGIEQIGWEASHVDMHSLIPHPRYKLYGRIFLALCAVVAALGIATPAASWNAFERWSHPGSPPERFTFTQLSALPSRLVVPMGEMTSFRLQLASSTRNFPSIAAYRFNKGVWSESPIMAEKSEEGRDATWFYSINIPAFQKPVSLNIKVGDVAEEITVIPKPRPALQRAVAELALPDYIGQSKRELPVRAGVVSALQGSQVTLKAFASQDLARVEIQSSSHSKQVQINGNEAVFPAITVGKAPYEWKFSWVDSDGLASHHEMTVKIEPIIDQKPVVRIHSNREDRYILSNTSVELQLESTDDYGLMELGIEWMGEKNIKKVTEGTAEIAEYASSPSRQQVLVQGGKQSTYLDSSFVFQADELGISPQRVLLRAFARDYYPGRPRVYSEPLMMIILTPEEHAQMIREALERLNSGLEDLIREMDVLSDETDKLLRLDAEQLDSRENRDTLQELAAQEQSNLNRLNELRGHGEKIFKAASRNSQVDPDALKNLLLALQEMEGVSNNQLPKAQQGLNKSSTEQGGQGSGQPQDKSMQQQRLSEAEQLHKSAAEELRDIHGRLSEAVEQMEASTYAARLRFALRQEESIIESLVSRVNAVAGLSRTDYNTSDKRNFDNIQALQVSTARLVGWILNELNHFRYRNEDMVYSNLYTDMLNSEIVGKLEYVAENIRNAHVGISIENASQCVELLKRWITVLDGVSKPGGGVDVGNNDSLSDEDFEFVLKVMRMIQQQQDIRMRTRALEENRNTPQS